MDYGEKIKCLPPQMRWGKDNEPIAIKCYLESRHKNGEAISFEPTGLHLLPEKCYLGASSDGKLLCTSVDTCCCGCLEIKCPYSIDGSLTINLTPNEIAEKYGKNFSCTREKMVYFIYRMTILTMPKCKEKWLS